MRERSEKVDNFEVVNRSASIGRSDFLLDIINKYTRPDDDSIRNSRECHTHYPGFATISSLLPSHSHEWKLLQRPNCFLEALLVQKQVCE